MYYIARLGVQDVIWRTSSAYVNTVVVDIVGCTIARLGVQDAIWRS